MHHILRPELRGAQRVLRLLQPLKTARPLRVSPIRSFSSFRRLQDQTPAIPPSRPPLRPGHSYEKSGQKNPLDSLKETLQDDSAASDNELDNLASIFEAIDKGEVPTGYHVAESFDDLPETFERDHLTEHVEFPVLHADDPKSKLQTIALPKDFPRASVAKDSAYNPPSISSADANNLSLSDQLRNSLQQGSLPSRRRRVRQTRASRTDTGTRLPPWFIKNNVSRPQTDVVTTPKVVPVQQLQDGTYTSVTAGFGHAQAQLPRRDVEGRPQEPREQTHATGGDSDPSTAGSPLGPPQSASEPAEQGRKQVSLTDGRYFIESAQYEELLNTFKGRIRRGTNELPFKDDRQPFSMHHLTILHGASNADQLLDALVLDLCKAVGVDRVRLDIQDISELIAAADVDEATATRGGRLSFKVYKDIYGPSNLYQDTFVPQEDDVEEDEEDEEDDEAHQSNTFDIPIGSVVAWPAGSKPGNIFNDIRKSMPSLSRFFEPPSSGAPRPPSIASSFASSKEWSADTVLRNMAESILNAGLDAQTQKKHPAQDAVAAETQPSHRPIVVQIPTYRALQNHALPENLVGEILSAADRRSRDGQSIIVIGTDCMRDFSNTRNARAILDEQEARSWGGSSAIVLTPVLPTRDAELNLIRDRENKIRDINARHLFQALKSRGILLKGLEDGFWARDYTAELGEEDCKALSESYWPFVHVQRIAALIAGNDQSQTPIADAVNTINQSDESKVAWARRNQPDTIKLESKDADKREGKTIKQIRASATRHEKKLLSGVIEPKKISTTFKDIHIPAETVEALQTLTTLSLVRPDAFKYGVLKSDRIPGLLLYGPPGTGKTLAAKAVAKESGATMLEVSAADLNDMYVGEGEKNVQALFSLAKKLSPCVVFLDEADAMFSARAASGRRVSHRELLNQFLKEWDGMSNDAGSAFIMVATNRPMDLDDAVLRRLPRRLLVDLPTEQDRLEILRIHLRNEKLGEDVNLQELAKKTPFYSGSDLKNVAVAAALCAVREENETAQKYHDQNPDSEAPYQYPEQRTLKQLHFDKALEEISASISEDMSSLREIKKFDEQYGDRKGRKRKAPRWGFKSATEADKVLDTIKVRS